MWDDVRSSLLSLCFSSPLSPSNAAVCCQVEALAAVSLNRPVRLFVDQNTDTADNLQQEFVRVRAKRETDREAIVTGE